MITTLALRGMLRTDLLRVIRDRFLIGMTLYIVGISVVMRWALPGITTLLDDRWGFDLRPWHVLLVCHSTVVLTGILTGLIGGFLLLETREERTVMALLVTPTPLGSYLLLFSIVLVLIGSAFAIMEATIIGIALPPWPALVVAAIGGASAGPVNAFFQATFASNKVEAIAYSKFVSSAALIALGAYFLPEPWQWFAGIYPPYWAAKCYWAATDGSPYWPYWGLGAPLTSLLWGTFFARRFLRRVREH